MFHQSQLLILKYNPEQLSELYFISDPSEPPALNFVLYPFTANNIYIGGRGIKSMYYFDLQLVVFHV